MSEVVIVYAAGFLSGAFLSALLMGQLVGWWARRNGGAYVIKHLEVTKP